MHDRAAGACISEPTPLTFWLRLGAWVKDSHFARKRDTDGLNCARQKSSFARQLGMYWVIPMSLRWRRWVWNVSEIVLIYIRLQCDFWRWWNKLLLIHAACKQALLYFSQFPFPTQIWYIYWSWCCTYLKSLDNHNYKLFELDKF